MEYVVAARNSGRPFIAVTLVCGIEENIQRVQSADRQYNGARKLLDPEVLKAMRTRSKLFCFDDLESLAVDVTKQLPREAAMMIWKYISSRD